MTSAARHVFFVRIAKERAGVITNPPHLSFFVITSVSSAPHTIVITSGLQSARDLLFVPPKLPTTHSLSRPGPHARGFCVGRPRAWRDRGRAATAGRAPVLPALPRARPVYEVSQTDSRLRWKFGGAPVPASGGGRPAPPPAAYV